MDPFLKTVYLFAKEKLNGDFSHARFIFPNRRAGVYFKKIIALESQKPIWSPEILSIQDWVRKVTPYVYPSQLELLLELYETANKTNRTEFEQYIPWGEMILNDFDEIDKNLVDANHFFTYLKNYKELEYIFTEEEELEAARKFTQALWGRSPDEDHFRKKFLEWWEEIGDMYTNFNQKLRDKGIAYEGMGYKLLAENPEEYINKDHTYFFAGFNALSKAEVQIFSKLIKLEKAFLLDDADDYYMQDKMHDAGYFLRKQHKQLKSSLKNVHLLNAPERKVNTYGVPMRVGQAKLLGQNLKNSSTQEISNNQLPQTAIVLADESLLPTVLSSLPDESKHLNITMGYPLQYSLVYKFMEQVFEYFAHPMLQQKSQVRPVKKLYQLFSHPLMAGAVPEQELQKLNRLLDAEKLQVHVNELTSLELPEVLNQLLVFNPEVDIMQWTEKLIDPLLNFLIQLNIETINVIESQSTLYYRKEIKKIYELLSAFKMPVNAQTFQKILKKALSTVKIPFEGEPLEGVQLMGFLETRCLDFKKLHLLSFNEGFLPPSGEQQSFIPYQIRKAFKLPVNEEIDAISAYHFYRLLQRTEEVHLYYNAQPGEGGREGEVSRFLAQMELMSKIDAGKQIGKLTHFKQDFQFEKTNVAARKILKSKSLLFFLNERYFNQKRAFFPTQIALYLADPVEFYFRNVLRAHERQRLDEPDARMFGIAFHDVMEALYKPLLNQTLNQDLLIAAKDKVDDCLRQFFLKQYGIRTFSGSILMHYDLIKKLVLNMIDLDLAHLPFEIVYIEAFGLLRTKVNIEINGRFYPVYLDGKADRIEKKDNQLVVVDYKTGKDTLKARNFDDMEDVQSYLNDLIDNIEKNKAEFQTLMYAWMLQRKYSVEPVNAGIVSMRNPDKGVQLLSEEPIPSIVFEAFEHTLIGILEELFDPERHWESDLQNGKVSKLNTKIEHR